MLAVPGLPLGEAVEMVSVPVAFPLGANAMVCRDSTKDYGRGHGLFDLDLDIGRGEVFGFVGPNGAGKTTTIRSLTSRRSRRASSPRIADLPRSGRIGSFSSHQEG